MVVVGAMSAEDFDRLLIATEPVHCTACRKPVRSLRWARRRLDYVCNRCYARCAREAPIRRDRRTSQWSLHSGSAMYGTQ